MSIILLFSILLLLIIIKIPIPFAVGISSLVILIIEKIPLNQLITKMFGGMDSFTVLAIPFFMATGVIMNNGKLTKDLVKFADSLVGHVRGGLAHVNVLSSMFFAGISGSSTADSASIGSMLIPSMVEEGYDRKFSAAVTAASSSIGPIIPPSIMMIVYASLTGDSVGALFLGGIGPGVLLGVSQMSLCYFMTDKVYKPSIGGATKKKFEIKKVIESFKDAIIVLVIPIVIVVGIIFGIFTATEAGVITTVYSLIISIFVYKTINIKNIGSILLESSKSVGIVLLLMSTPSIFGNLLTLLNFPTMAVEFLTSLTSNRVMMLLIVIIFLFILGFFIDGMAILIMFAPVLLKLSQQLGFDPIYFGVLVVVSILIGGITPPVGVLLFVNCKIAKITLDELIKAIWPFVFLMLGVVIIAAIFPPVITFIPNLLIK